MISEQIDSIKSSVNELTVMIQSTADPRDVAGLNKIMFELNLLKEKFPEEEAQETSEESDD